MTAYQVHWDGLKFFGDLKPRNARDCTLRALKNALFTFCARIPNDSQYVPAPVEHPSKNTNRYGCMAACRIGYLSGILSKSAATSSAVIHVLGLIPPMADGLPCPQK